MKKLILSAALTGAATNRSHCPYIPYTPKEIGEEAKRAVDAGASIVHIHAREDDGFPSWRLEVFEQIHEEVRKHCPHVIINYSTGAIGITKEERLNHIGPIKPDMAAFNMGSMNYAIYSKKQKRFYLNGVFENSFDTMQYAVGQMNKAGTIPEMECFDTGHIRNAIPLRDMGLLPDNAVYSLVMGVLGGIPATTPNLMHQISEVPQGAHWQVIAISRKQWQMAAVACTMGGSFRVGLEDNFYLPNNEMAKSNGECVEWGVKLANMMGRKVATIAEAREMLNIPQKNIRYMLTSDTFKDKVVLVTGGRSGIGYAIAKLLLQKGAKVTIASRKEAPLKAAAAELAAFGPCDYKACDIRKTEEIQAIAKQIRERHGRLDILINNAGGQFPILAEMLNDKGWNAVINNNLNGTFFMTREMTNAFFIPQNEGIIVNIIANIHRGFPGMVHTGAARAGVENMTKTLTIEWADYNIRINCVAPGTIESSGLDQYPAPIQELFEAAQNDIPAKRFGKVEEVADAVAFLASSMATYINGITLYVDGAQHLNNNTAGLPQTIRSLMNPE